VTVGGLTGALASCIGDPGLGQPEHRRPGVSDVPGVPTGPSYHYKVLGKKTAFEVDDRGVRRIVRGQVVESIDWRDLSEVALRTTATGPTADDVFILLSSTDDIKMSIPQSCPEANDVLQHVQVLPGFDHAAVVAAMGATEDAVFRCWQA
jgi:hypothetical protein